MLRNLAFASALVILMIGISSWYWHSFLLIFVLFALFSLFNGAGMPLQDSCRHLESTIGLDYGRRLIGSLGFVIGVVVFGALISYLGDPAIIWVILALLVVYILYQLPTPATLPISNQQTAQAESISYRQLLSEANTRRLLIAISLIQGISRCLLCLQHALLGFARNRSENDQPIVGHFCGSGSDLFFCVQIV